MHLHVRGQRTRHRHLLPGKLHQILNIQLRGVEIDLQGTCFREGPLAQTGAGVEGDLSMRGRFQIRVLQTGQRWTHVHIGSQHAPLCSVDSEIEKRSTAPSNEARWWIRAPCPETTRCRQAPAAELWTCGRDPQRFRARSDCWIEISNPGSTAGSRRRSWLRCFAAFADSSASVRVPDCRRYTCRESRSPRE